MCDTNHKKVHQWDIKTMVTIKSGRVGVAGVRKRWGGRAGLTRKPLRAAFRKRGVLLFLITLNLQPMQALNPKQNIHLKIVCRQKRPCTLEFPQ